jgi:hypothetical protein
MTQLTEEHFELHSKNKAEQHERQKIKFLEDRIKVLENAIESHAKILFGMITTLIVVGLYFARSTQDYIDEQNERYRKEKK